MELEQHAPRPFWGPVTSSVDWCEKNYAWSRFIAEWWNTWSNVPGLALGVAAMVLATKKVASRKTSRPLQPVAIAIAYFCPIIVFAGSFAFHSTLTYVGQLLDELPMIYGTLYFHYLLGTTQAEMSKRPVARRRAYKKHLARILFGLGAAITLLMIVLRESPLPLQLSYGALVVGMVFRSTFTAQGSGDDRQQQRNLLKVAFLTYGTGFALWLIEQAMCDHLDGLQFHAMWHLLTATGTYLWIQFAACLHIEGGGIYAKRNVGVVISPLAATSQPKAVAASEGGGINKPMTRLRVGGGSSDCMESGDAGSGSPSSASSGLGEHAGGDAGGTDADRYGWHAFRSFFGLNAKSLWGLPFIVDHA